MHPDYYHPGSTVARIVSLTILSLVGAVIIAFLFGYFVMLLWNWLLPPLLHAGTINYWQAFGIVILAKILFGGMGGAHHDRGHRGWGRPAGPWAAGPGHGGWKGPWRWEECWADEWAPKGSHRYWRHYGQYWKDEGKAAFEAWLDKQPKDQGPDKDRRPDQQKAE